MAERLHVIARAPRPLHEPAAPSADVIELELQLLGEAVLRLAGHDVRSFTPAAVRRRVQDRVRAEGLATIAGLLERVVHDPPAMQRLLDALTATPSAPFREPSFFRELADQVIPRLRTFPHLRVWVAGCGAGHDAYALAVLFHEAGLDGRFRIYATDVAEAALARATRGAEADHDVEDVEVRYLAAGGNRRLADYLEPGPGFRYRPSLRTSIVFSQHNLVTDGTFNDFHLIVARDVLGKYAHPVIYRAHQVFYGSLVRLGFLGLGTRDSLAHTPHERAYDRVPETTGLFRRVR